MILTKKLEYIFIGLSILGAIGAVNKQQLAYFVAPATISLSLNLVNRQKEITRTNVQIAKLEQSLFNYDQSNTKEINAVKTSLLSIASSETYALDDSVKKLDSDLAFLKENIFNTTANHKASFIEITANNKNLHTLISNIKLQLENALKGTDDLPEIYRQINALNSGISARVNETVDRAVSDKKINQAIQQTISKELTAIQQVYSDELIEGRIRGREVFLEALSQAENRLILVCPWITEYAIDSDVKKLVFSALRKGVAIHVGWGYLNDVKHFDNLSEDDLLRTSKASGASKWDKIKYGAVDWFRELRKQYPSLVKMKALGTHSKYLVCDRKFALVGSHNFMSSNDRTSFGVSQEEETGLKVTNPHTINNIIRSFDKVRAADKKTVQKSSRS